MLALHANRAFTQRVPLRDLPLARQCQLDRHFIGVALAAQHFTQQNPTGPAGHDIQAQHMLADIQRHAALPGDRVCEARQ